jgi:hypothetical protein
MFDFKIIPKQDLSIEGEVFHDEPQELLIERKCNSKSKGRSISVIVTNVLL